jgi:hypothetical protein
MERNKGERAGEIDSTEVYTGVKMFAGFKGIRYLPK